MKSEPSVRCRFRIRGVGHTCKFYNLVKQARSIVLKVGGRGRLIQTILTNKVLKKNKKCTSQNQKNPNPWDGGGGGA